MAFVGSLSGSTGTIMVTGSLVPVEGTNDLGTSSSKWRTVFANNITGSLQKTAGGQNFISAGPNVTVNYNSSGQFEISASSGGGASVFTEASNVAAHTTSSIAIGFAAAASTKGSDVFFAVSSSNPAVAVSTFSGGVVASGSLTIKDVFSNAVMASVSDAGVISGSSGLQIGGNITGSNALLRGDLEVNGGKITTTAGTFSIATSAATTVNIGSAATRVVIPGDLEVQGTTMTVSASNLVIEDPLVGFGFLSGSVATNAGDRGFIGGITGTGNNVAFVWSNSNSAFVATRTTSSPEDATVTVSALQPVRASKLEVNGTSAFVTSSDGLEIQVVAANVATVKSTGDKVTLDGATSKGVVFNIAGTSFAELKDASTHVQFGAVPGKEITVSGSTVSLNTGGTVNVLSNGSRIGQLLGNVGNNFKVQALDASGVTKGLVLSGSSLDLGANNAGISLNFADVTKGTFTSTGTALTLGTPSTVGLTLSGSTVTANFGTGGFVFQRDGVSELLVNVVGSTTTISGSASQSVTLAAGTGATTLTLSGSTVEHQATIAHKFKLGGTLIAHVTSSDGRQGFFPASDSAFDLGGPSIRWQNIYTGDLHLRNERGDYTLIEESDFLSIRFNKNGKRYKFLLERVPELDER